MGFSCNFIRVLTMRAALPPHPQGLSIFKLIFFTRRLILANRRLILRHLALLPNRRLALLPNRDHCPLTRKHAPIDRDHGHNNRDHVLISATPNHCSRCGRNVTLPTHQLFCAKVARSLANRGLREA